MLIPDTSNHSNGILEYLKHRPDVGTSFENFPSH